MPRFVFRFQAILDHRHRIEQERQRELAVARKQLLDLETELRGLNDEIRSATTELREHHLVGPISVGFLVSHRRFVLGMQGKAMATVQKMALAQRGVDDARRQLAEAARQRKIMEKLRERHLERWRADLAEKEAREMDEIGMQLAYRNLTDSADL
jgi:flagellar FliJ protein